MKKYKCKFCKIATTRKDARKCIQTHIKTNKHERVQTKESRMNSPITGATLTEEF